MIDEYLESKVSTATPYQLHLMVVDGALRHARAAEAALTQRKLPEARTALAEARRFVAEMMAGLNAQRLPELVDKLKSLFVYVLRNLVKADLQHDPQLVTDSIQVLTSHRETWLALAQRLKEESAAEAPAAAAGQYCWTS
jgi:flagellar secretion chaperone FliS